MWVCRLKFAEKQKTELLISKCCQPFCFFNISNQEVPRLYRRWDGLLLPAYRGQGSCQPVVVVYICVKTKNCTLQQKNPQIEVQRRTETAPKRHKVLSAIPSPIYRVLDTKDKNKRRNTKKRKYTFQIALVSFCFLRLHIGSTKSCR